MKRIIATSAAACGICLGLVAPIAPAVATAPVFDASVATPGTAFTDAVDVLGNWVEGPLDGALVVVVPGTDDTRSPRINGLVSGRESTIVSYPESFWPIISGKSGKLLPLFAPTYDKSRGIAVSHTLTVMEALKDPDRVVVYTGYSQGSDALGNAAEQAWKNGWLGANHTVLLVSDPRGPWGVKSKVGQVPLTTPLLSLIGITNDGARNPADTGAAKVVQVIVQGDPVGHFQWVWYRPVSSAVVNLAGFLAIHSGTGEYTYAHLENLEHVKTLTSTAGNTTYEIYDTYHPLALLNAMIHDALGLPVSQQQMERWDRMAEAFYPTQAITAGNADPKVGVTDAPLSSTDTVTSVSKTGGDHRLLDGAGEWAEPQPLVGASPSTGPRHAQAESADTGASHTDGTAETVETTTAGPSAPTQDGQATQQQGVPQETAPAAGADVPAAAAPSVAPPTVAPPTVADVPVQAAA